MIVEVLERLPSAECVRVLLALARLGRDAKEHICECDGVSVLVQALLVPGPREMDEPAGELLMASDEVITAGRSSFAGDRPRSASANAPGGGYKPRRHNSLMRPGGRLAPGSNDWKETGEYKRTYVPHSTKSRALVRSKSAGGAAKRASPGVSRHLFASVVQDAVNAESTSPLN